MTRVDDVALTFQNTYGCAASPSLIFLPVPSLSPPCIYSHLFPQRPMGLEHVSGAWVAKKPLLAPSYFCNTRSVPAPLHFSATPAHHSSLLHLIFGLLRSAHMLCVGHLCSPNVSEQSPTARHLGHFGQKKSASGDSSFIADYGIIASAHKTQVSQLRKLQNKGGFLWVLSTHIIFPMVARAPKHQQLASMGQCTHWTIKKRDILFLTITLANLRRFL